MSDRTIENTGTSNRLGAQPNEDAIASGQIGARAFRIDGAHASAPAMPDAAPAPVAPKPVVESGSASSTTLRRDAQVLLEAGQLIQQCYAQLADVEQRSAELAEREADLSRRMEASLAQFAAVQAADAERQAALASAEDSLLARFQHLEEDRQRQAEAWVRIEQADAEIAEQRARLQAEIDERMAARQAELDAIAARLDEWATTLATDEQSARIAREQTLRDEREKLWQSLSVEWDEHRAQFEQEKASWLVESTAAREQLASEQSLRLGELAEREAALSLREQNISELEEDLIRREQMTQALLSDLQERRQKAETGWAADFDEQRAAFEQELQQLRGALEEERAIWEARLKFQQDHLARTRQELELAQRDFQAEQQRERQRLQELEQQGQLRLNHLETFRLALEEREQSLAREEDVLAWLQRAEGSSEAEAEQAARQREWEQSRDAHRDELRRQSEMVTTQLAQLDSRRQRLDRLRVELEETHRLTLEMRLAVEEAWATIAQQLGDDEARARVEQSRAALHDYYRQLHASLEERRAELAAMQSECDQQRGEFAEQRQQMADWIAQRDEELRLREEQLREQATELETLRHTWQVMRHRWQGEKLQAERTIRRLLADLTQQHQRLATDRLPTIPSEEFIATQLAALDRQEPLPEPVPPPAYPLAATPRGALHE